MSLNPCNFISAEKDQKDAQIQLGFGSNGVDHADTLGRNRSLQEKLSPLLLIVLMMNSFSHHPRKKGIFKRDIHQ